MPNVVRAVTIKRDGGDSVRNSWHRTNQRGVNFLLFGHHVQKTAVFRPKEKSLRDPKANWSLGKKNERPALKLLLFVLVLAQNPNQAGVCRPIIRRKRGLKFKECSLGLGIVFCGKKRERENLTCRPSSQPLPASSPPAQCCVAGAHPGFWPMLH